MSWVQAPSPALKSKQPGGHLRAVFVPSWGGWKTCPASVPNAADRLLAQHRQHLAVEAVLVLVQLLGDVRRPLAVERVRLAQQLGPLLGQLVDVLAPPLGRHLL